MAFLLIYELKLLSSSNLFFLVSREKSSSCSTNLEAIYLNKGCGFTLIFFGVGGSSSGAPVKNDGAMSF